MKKLLFIAGMGIAACMLSACSRNDSSPRIVCDLNGKVVPTVFTFDQFKQTLAAEHGQAQATGYEQLQSASLIVYFKPLDNNRLLAEHAIVVKSGQYMPPAILFGLTNAVRPSFQAPPLPSPGSNFPMTAQE
jgi:hypothetical protein